MKTNLRSYPFIDISEPAEIERWLVNAAKERKTLGSAGSEFKRTEKVSRLPSPEHTSSKPAIPCAARSYRSYGSRKYHFVIGAHSQQSIFT